MEEQKKEEIEDKNMIIERRTYKGCKKATVCGAGVVLLRHSRVTVVNLRSSELKQQAKAFEMNCFLIRPTSFKLYRQPRARCSYLRAIISEGKKKYLQNFYILLVWFFSEFRSIFYCSYFVKDNIMTISFTNKKNKAPK